MHVPSTLSKVLSFGNLAMLERGIMYQKYIAMLPSLLGRWAVKG